MGDALQRRIGHVDDDLAGGVAVHAPGPRLVRLEEGVGGVDDQADLLEVQQVEEHVHVGLVGDVHEGEVLLLRQRQRLDGARHEPLGRRVQVDHEPGRRQLRLVLRERPVRPAVDDHVVLLPERALWRCVRHGVVVNHFVCSQAFH